MPATARPEAPPAGVTALVALDLAAGGMGMIAMPGASATAAGRSSVAEGDAFRHDVMIRRNVLFGLRVARLMGVPFPEREAYAWSVHFADLREPGDADMLDKVSRDLAGRRVALSRAELRRHLREAEVQAHLDLVGQRHNRASSQRARPPWQVG